MTSESMDYVPASLDDVLITAELARRPTLSPDYAAEGRALTALAAAMADSPQTILQKLVETALNLCRADSAGINILEAGGVAGVFRWHAIAGQFAWNIGSHMPREVSPSGIVLDRDSSLLLSYPERHFEYAMAIDPPIVEALLVPFHNEGKPVGTLWVIAHTPSRKFDTEDQRLLTSLSHFASTAYQEKVTALAAVRAKDDVRQILDSAAIGLSRCSRDLRYLECNRAYERLTGLSTAQIIGRLIADVLGTKAFEVIRPYVESVLRGERVEYEEEVSVSLPVSGDVPRFFHVVYEPWFDSEGRITGFIASVSETTELKRTTKALRDSEERLRLAMSSGPIGVWDWDESSERLTASPEIGRIYGVDVSNLQTFEDFARRVHPDDLARIESESDAAIENHEPFDTEFRILRPSGEIRWIAARGQAYYDQNGQVVRMVANNIDITERVQVKEALRESKERETFLLRLADTLRSLSDPVAIQEVTARLLGEHLQVNRVNYADIEGTDYIIRLSHVNGVAPNVRRGPVAAFGAWLLESYRSGEPVVVNDVHTDPRFTESERARLQAAEIAAFAGVMLVKDKQCAIFSVNAAIPRVWIKPELKLIHDVAERIWEAVERARAEEALAARRAEERDRELHQQAEEALRRSHAELERRTLQLSRLASQLTLAEQSVRKQIASTLHDGLQQLLFSAGITLDQVHSNGQADQAVLLQRARSVVKEAIEAARTLTVNLFPPVLHAGGLPAALRWLARRTQEQYKVVVNVTADPQANPETSEVRILLFEGVRELLFNAVKHARVDRIDVNLGLGPGETIHIQVSDDGAGFDPGATLYDRNQPQAGLGLFSIQERLALLGGHLDIVSAPGTGSRFTLILPCTGLPGLADSTEELRRDTDRHERPVHKPTPRTSKSLRVLIADDHAVVRAGLRELLSARPELLVVGEAANGVEAISHAKTLQPDIILMDVAMPQKNGIEATREIHDTLPHIQVVGLSTYADETTERAMREAGAQAYFSKTESTHRLFDYVLSLRPHVGGASAS